ncbi:MAG: hypothetical protein JXD22_00575 [Sedimentisphaerales bacterium]|nr:hypothetical protein [Sedimentisphaerales bacterium]
MKQMKFFTILVLVICFCGTAVAEKPEYNVDIFIGWNGCFRPLEWTPVEIGIGSNLTEPLAGQILISAQQDELNVMNISQDFVLQPDLPLHLPMVTKLAFAADKCRLRLVNQNGKTLWKHDLDLWDYSDENRYLKAVEKNDLLIGVIGPRKFGLTRLAKNTSCCIRYFDPDDAQKTRGQQIGQVYLEEKLPAMAPWDWTGYVSVDLLILYNPDWQGFRIQQLNAIAQWVSNGGKLLVVLADNPVPPKNPLAQLLPANIQSARQGQISPGLLRQWSLDPQQSESVTCWPLTPKPDANFSRTQKNTQGQTLFCQAYRGFGRVGVIAFDPAQMSEKQQSHAGQFWTSQIAAILEDSAIDYADAPTPNNDEKSQNYYGRQTFHQKRSIIYTPESEKTPGEEDENQYYDSSSYRLGFAQIGSNAIMEHLYSISEMRPLSIWWVILLLTLLALLLGPIDYKFLKSRGKLPLTWLTSTFWIIVFSVGAYYGIQAIRGGKMQLRTVSVIDGIKNSDHNWSTSYTGLFAPFSENYQFENLQEQQWWSGISPAQDYLYLHDHGVGSRNIFCRQVDGSNLPTALPVNIWSMQTLLNESPLDQMPIDASLTKQQNQWTLTIINLSDHPVKNGYVLMDNNQIIPFEKVPPHTTITFNNNIVTDNPWAKPFGTNGTHEYNSFEPTPKISSKNEIAFFARGILQRTEAIQAYLAHGAAVVCAEFENAPTPFQVKDYACEYNHIQIARLIIFPLSLDEVTKND